MSDIVEARFCVCRTLMLRWLFV